MRRMITFDEDHIRFTHRVVGVALDRDRGLLHRTDSMNFWALPGGRAELLEPSPETLVREMCEELGVEVKVDRLLWLAENFFEYGAHSYHEIGFYFLMHLPPDSPLRDQTTFLGHEDNLPIYFEWHPLATLENVRLYPTFLRTGLKSIPTNIVHIIHTDDKEEGVHP
ncbi:MAG TPA: NUDIX hydrolase [Anaerolineae bacterium]|nr:NUDIX hydrolase [Anaerolineae bacterium]